MCLFSGRSKVGQNVVFVALAAVVATAPLPFSTSQPSVGIASCEDGSPGGISCRNNRAWCFPCPAKAALYLEVVRACEFGLLRGGLTDIVSSLGQVALNLLLRWTASGGQLPQNPRAQDPQPRKGSQHPALTAFVADMSHPRKNGRGGLEHFAVGHGRPNRCLGYRKSSRTVICTPENAPWILGFPALWVDARRKPLSAKLRTPRLFQVVRPGFKPANGGDRQRDGWQAGISSASRRRAANHSSKGLCRQMQTQSHSNHGGTSLSQGGRHGR